MAIRKISEFVEASSPQNSDKLLLERNGSGKSITVGNLLNDVVTRTRVNLLRPSLATTTTNGITCTNNGDGTFTINGTAADNTVFTLAYVGRMSGYKLIGCPTNNSGSYLAILRGSDDAWTDVISDGGDGAEISSLNTTRNPVVIAIEQGLTINNVVFKPMITNDLSATYDDFIPYDNSLAVNSLVAQKSDVLTLEEIQASTDLTGKVAGADSIRKAVIKPGLNKIRRFFSATDSGTVALFKNVPYDFRISAILIGNGNGTLTFAYLTLFSFESSTGGDISGNYSVQGTKNEDGTVDISISGVEPWGRYTLLVFYGY